MKPEFLRDTGMQQNKFWKLVSLTTVALILTLVWVVPIDQAATKAVDEGLKRTLVTYATARAANAALSVVESAQVGIVLGQLTIGKVLHPLNELVGQFADIMLAASVAFGVMKLLMIAGGSTAVSVALSVIAAGWLWFRVSNRAIPRLLHQALLLAVVVRLSVPITMLGSEAIYHHSFSKYYAASQQELQIEDKIGNPPANPLKVADWIASVKVQAENWIQHVINLIALFLLQTLLVPGVVFLVFIGVWRRLVSGSGP